MFRRLQWRIALGYVLLFVLVLLGLGLYLRAQVHDQQLAALETQLTREARLVGDDVQPQLAGGDTAGLDARAKQLGQDIDARVTIIRADGVVLGDSDHDPATMENHGTRPEVLQALRQGSGESQRHSATLDRDLLYVAVPIEAQGRVVGIARVALPITDVRASLDRLVAVISIALLVAALLAVLIAVPLARLVTSHLQTLGEGARRLAAGDFSEPIPVRGRDEISQLAVTFNEMAARLAAQIRTIEDERERLAAVLGHMADGVVIVGGDGAVQLVNPAAGRLLGIDSERVPGQTAGEGLRDHEIVGLVREALASGRPAGPLLLSLAGRRPEAIQALASPIPGHAGGERRVLLMLRDVSHLQRTEAVRRDFVANVSHELRTPVAVLKALVETLQDGALDDPEVAPEFIARMHVEVDRLAQLIEELLELSRIESGQVALRLRSADLGAVVTQAAERLRPQAERQGVALQVVAPSGLPAVAIDPDRIQQVVLNLVHNAVKFTPPGGQVTVATAGDADALTVTVADTGAGIPPEALPRLFERFYKTDRARSGGGTGLGLAIVKHLVQVHGGEVAAASPGEGRGATFSFTIPLSATAASAAGPPARGNS